MGTEPNETTGKTKDAGWEVGVRKTVSAPVSAVWEFLVGDGLPLWLGEGALPTEKGASYQTADGVRGQVRGYTAGVRVRLTWQPEDWPHDTTLQVTVKEAAGGTTIGFHHDQLADRDERRMMLGHWKNVVADLAEALARR
ncbi:SRPBCC domain-containing protein [Glaciibacter sp. 2TAF33]|uniref:SRPBCC domain-containing protein n=1 Tax=Glaciibacter sp. 2TAF33 TaxID=3233015 RepID=UPI003F91186E